jgi:hypothetical protein
MSTREAEHMKLMREALQWLSTQALGPGETLQRRAQLVARDALDGKDWRRRLTPTQAAQEEVDEP